MDKSMWTGLSAHNIVLAILNESHEPLKTSKELVCALLDNAFGKITADQRKALEAILNRTERVMDLLASLQEGDIPD